MPKPRISTRDIEINDWVLCASCIHYQGGFPAKCKAFPNKIPRKIYNEGFNHKKPFPGDSGIRFEKIKK